MHELRGRWLPLFNVKDAAAVSLGSNDVFHWPLKLSTLAMIASWYLPVGISCVMSPSVSLSTQALTLSGAPARSPTVAP